MQGITADILHASPSCKLLSSAPHWTKAQLATKADEARRELLEDVTAICQVVESCAVETVTIEETDALAIKSVHARAYEEMWEALEALPFTWRCSIIDVAHMGARHHRSRIGIVGSRRAEDRGTS